MILLRVCQHRAFWTAVQLVLQLRRAQIRIRIFPPVGGDIALRSQAKRAAALAAEENTLLKTVDDSQGSSVSSEAVAAGGGANYNRMDVGQSSASEADLSDDGSSDQGSVDEETLLCSPSQLQLAQLNHH